jgi:hypothetical protein
MLSSGDEKKTARQSGVHGDFFVEVALRRKTEIMEKSSKRKKEI